MTRPITFQEAQQAEEPEDEGYWPCPECCKDDGEHLFGCSYNIDPFQELTDEGYD